MVIGLLLLDLHLPQARSLKEKRMVVRRFRDRVRALFVEGADSGEFRPMDAAEEAYSTEQDAEFEQAGRNATTGY